MLSSFVPPICKKGVLMAFVSSSAVAIPGAGAFPPDHRAHGAQSLLSGKPPKQHYTAQGVALALYALLIGAAVTTAFKPAASSRRKSRPSSWRHAGRRGAAAAARPGADRTAAGRRHAAAPMALDPIAPIEEAKPTPKPIEKVEEEVDKPVERKQTAAPRAAVPVARAPAAPPGAQVSEIANHFHACMQRAPPTPIRNRKRRAPRIFPITRHSGLPAR